MQESFSEVLLQDELTELNAKAVQNEKTMEDISTENKRLLEPLAQAQSEVQELQHKLQNFEKDKRSLKLSRARLLVLDHTLKSTTAQHEDLERRFNEVEMERDNLYLTFENTILAVQKKSNAKNIILEKKLDSYTERYSRKKRQFDEVLAAANLDNSVVTNLTNKLDAVIDSKNTQIKNLRFDIAKVTKVMAPATLPHMSTSDLSTDDMCSHSFRLTTTSFASTRRNCRSWAFLVKTLACRPWLTTR